MSRQQMEEILYRALRAIYLFERVEIERFGLNYQQMYLLKFLKRKSPFRISDIAGELQIPSCTKWKTRGKQSLKRGLLLLRDLGWLKIVVLASPP